MTSRAERRGRALIRHLEGRDDGLAVREDDVLVLEIELNGLAQVLDRFLDGAALAGDIDLGTERHEQVPFPVDDC